MVLEHFNNYLRYEKRFSAHTVNAYFTDIRQFELFLSKSDLNLLSVTHHNIRSWMVDMAESKADPRSLQRKLSSLRTLYKFFQRENILEENPTLQVKAPKAAKKLPVFIEDGDLNSLLDSAEVFSDDFTGRRDRVVIELLFGTGIRLAELITIKDTDINNYERSIKIFGKRSKERIVPVNVSLMEILNDYILERSKLENQNLSSTFIVTSEGKPAYSKLIYRIVNKYLSQISTNKKTSPHVLRHSFATSLLNKGADLNAIKELLGHSSLAATQVYTHNSVERLKLIYNQAHPKA